MTTDDPLAALRAFASQQIDAARADAEALARDGQTEAAQRIHHAADRAEHLLHHPKPDTGIRDAARRLAVFEVMRQRD